MTSGNTADSMVRRHAEQAVTDALSDTPVTILQGARQVGKSTLAQQLVTARGGRLVSMDTTAARDAATSDPEGFVNQPVDGLFAIDEVQLVPALLRAVKAAVDSDRRPGRFLLTGSADLLHVPNINESLAGRAETVSLYGFSQGEILGRRDDLVGAVLAGGRDWISAQRSDVDRPGYATAICNGGYPEALRRNGRRQQAWFDSYITRVVDHDAGELNRLVGVSRLDRVLRLVAANNAGELVRARIARDADMPESTLPGYLRLLQDLFMIHLIPAWGHSLTARVVGRPKAALLDSGLAAHLAGVTPQALGAIPGSDHLGGLLEGFVAGELRRQQAWSADRYTLGHFRDRTGTEVDLVVEARDGSVIGIEVKATRTVTARMFRGLEVLRSRLGSRFRMGLVLHTGPASLPFGDRMWAAPASCVWAAPGG